MQDTDGRSIIVEMNKTRLISWKNGRYEMNESVKIILDFYMDLYGVDTRILLKKLNFIQGK